MPRSPLLRTSLAILPIFGAILAALAEHKGLPIPLSLFAMAVVASSSAVIYWSAPLSKRNATPLAEPNLLVLATPNVMPEVAAAAEQLEPATESLSRTAQRSPEPGTVGTR